MVIRYRKLWPNHPFHFYVPYQLDDPVLDAGLGTNVTGVKCSQSIVPTVLSLLDFFEDHEWIYWCIDDKYPLDLDITQHDKVANLVSSNCLADIDGLCLSRVRRLFDGKALARKWLGIRNVKYLAGAGFLFKRIDYSQIWLHQYLRAGVLRKLFQAFPSSIDQAKELDFYKDNMYLAGDVSLYVTTRSFILFGESSSRGVPTLNCLKSMLVEDLVSSDQVKGGAPKNLIAPPKATWKLICLDYLSCLVSIPSLLISLMSVFLCKRQSRF